jgi:hypothetical protein
MLPLADIAMKLAAKVATDAYNQGHFDGNDGEFQNTEQYLLTQGLIEGK